MSDICSTQSCCNPHHLYTSSHIHTVSVSKSQTCPNQSIANQAIPSCWGMGCKHKLSSLFWRASSQHAGWCCPFPRALSFNSFIASSGAMGGSIVVRTCRSTGWEHRFMASVSWLMKEAIATSVPCWFAPHLDTCDDHTKWYQMSVSWELSSRSVLGRTQVTFWLYTLQVQKLLKSFILRSTRWSATIKAFGTRGDWANALVQIQASDWSLIILRLGLVSYFRCVSLCIGSWPSCFWLLQ